LHFDFYGGIVTGHALVEFSLATACYYPPIRLHLGKLFLTKSLGYFRVTFVQLICLNKDMTSFLLLLFCTICVMIAIGSQLSKKSIS